MNLLSGKLRQSEKGGKVLKNHLLIRIFCILSIVSISFFLHGAQQPQQKEEIVGSNSLIDNLKWRCLGPANMGGRISSVSVQEENPHIIYVGTASGGLWKTSNNGITWQPLFDQQSSSSIGDVSVSRSHPDIVWVGTGEANNRQSSSWGDGVFKSTDGGKSWQNMGLRESHHIGKIVIDPANPNVVYVAALGHLWGPNRERGIFKTTNGGKTWVNVLYIDENTGVVDIAMDPDNQTTLYAAAYQRQRRGWGFSGGGEGSGLYKSTDGGENWIKLTDGSRGLPSGPIGRIGIDIYHSDPRIVYAIVEHKQGGVFRSNDKGMTWEKTSSLNPRPMYYSKIRIDPNNNQRIWVLGGSMHVSGDGGKTFDADVIVRFPRQERRVHSDQHALWINPKNSNHMVLGNDGGVYISYDRGNSWDFINVMPLGQFYEIGFDMRKPYFVYGGLQDNGCWGGPSASWRKLGITNEDWFKFGGGDGFYTQVDPNDHTVIYGESQFGNLFRFDLVTGLSKQLKPEPEDFEERYRFNWNSPFLISPHDSNVIYLGGNKLFISRNRGETWESTKDLTTQQDKEKLPIMGILSDDTTLSRDDGIPFYGTITTISESPIREGLLYVGTDDGNLQISKDGGKRWTNIIKNVNGVPNLTYVSRVVASCHAEGRAYAAFDNHRNDDFNPYVFMTSDFGKTWENISNQLPHGGTVNVIREHHRNPNLLFAGTERGAYFSLDRGKNWTMFNNNFPVVPVDDIAVHPRENDLIFGTHGRSIWILDDITPLEQLTNVVLDSSAHLFDIRTATMHTISFSNVDFFKGQIGHKVFVAPNPPYGAIINYYLQNDAAAAREVEITISDSSGKKIRKIKNQGQPGINRICWDFRYDPPDSNDFQAPLVLPGSYRVKLEAAGTDHEKSFQIESDPHIDISHNQRKAQHDALLQIYNVYPAVSSSVPVIKSMKAQIEDLQKHLRNVPNIPDAIHKQIQYLSQKIRRVEMDLLVRQEQSRFSIRNRLLNLYRKIERFPEAPTHNQLHDIKKSTEAIKNIVERINEIIEKDIPRLNRMLIEHDIPYLASLKKIDFIW